jgi:hypothetical protein
VWEKGEARSVLMTAVEIVFVCASGGCGEDAGGGRGGLGQLKRIWAGWASKWHSHLLLFFPFSFLILAVEMGWMGHYMAAHLMLHLFFLFSLILLYIAVNTYHLGKRLGVPRHA